MSQNMVPYQIEHDVDLAPYNTFGVRARAHQLAHLYDASALSQLMEMLDHPPLILGGGSNVLFTHDYAGSIIVMRTQGVHVEEREQVTAISVAAGEIWDDFVRWSLGQGYAGLENLILIPGSVGAAPIQNIGAYGVEVAQYIESVETWDTVQQQVVILDNAACDFAYRNSLFKRHPERYIITAVRFSLPHASTLHLDYAGLQQQLQQMRVPKPTAYHVAEAVQTLRTRKLPDPAIVGNAGSFFKNPIVTADTAADILVQNARIRHWPMAQDQVKLSAAALIDSLGLKGTRQGDAGISNRHALVLVNHGHASGAELWAFARHIITTVKAHYGIVLEPEPRIIDSPV